MKKTIFVVISLIIAISLVGCKHVKTASDENETYNNEPQTEYSKKDNLTEEIILSEEQLVTVKHLIEKWENYLYVSEQMYSAELWAIDYVDRYLETNTWIDLSHARTACINASSFQKNMSTEIEDLTEEEYNTLLLMGLDTSYQSNEFSMAELMLEESRGRIRDNILVSLEENIFWRAGFELLKTYADLYRQYVMNYCSYNCAVANYQIADLAAHGYTDNTLQSSLAEKYPTVFSCGYQWQSDTESCQSAVDLILDQNEELNRQIADAISQNSADLFKFKEAIKNGTSDDFYSEEMNLIKELPNVIPAPYWYQSSLSLYMTMKEKDDGTVEHQDVGTDLGDEIYMTVVLVPDISQDEFMDYCLELEKIGFPQMQLSDGSTAIITLDYYAIFDMTENGLMITFMTQDSAFVPAWYFNMLQ